ncbi:exodeoxyribonuclease V subunit gamma [Pasteurellaceae bacterium RH1A]|nr:exodeoxyribonuclease V subunit gamma [Pasteurellaceae bacterium RH1A]
MFTVYYSNQLSLQKELLLHLLRVQPNSNPFEPETILVQSTGMAQWLQMQLAQGLGVAGNFNFPFPTAFLWQLYRQLFPHLPKENSFDREIMVWRLMTLIPEKLGEPAFAGLKAYLGEQVDQEKCFQLAEKIADLFDQYLVYRPHWLIDWEKNQTGQVIKEIQNLGKNMSDSKFQHILKDMAWQAELWRSLVAHIGQTTTEEVFTTSHRAYFEQRFFHKLDNLSPAEKQALPKRIFIFGISSLPNLQLNALVKLSEHCDIHLFFISPSQYYWGNLIERKVWHKMALKNNQPALEQEGNSLLAMWGKQGRDFLTTLVEREFNENVASVADSAPHLLAEVKRNIFELEEKFAHDFHFDEADRSIQLHACHSPLREVEVLHNQLLNLFEEDSSLAPKDIIVMSPDIDRYAPYIRAVFERYAKNDPRYIPFSLSDQRASLTDPLLASFLQLLKLKAEHLTAEACLELLDLEAIREKFGFGQADLHTLRHWVKQAGIRAGLSTNEGYWQNFNAWENGLNRLLLGASLKEQAGPWQDTLAFNQSYGLSAELAGSLAAFIGILGDWLTFLSQPHCFEDWQAQIRGLLANLYAENDKSLDSLLQIQQALDQLGQQMAEAHFQQAVQIELISAKLERALNQQASNLQFLAGQVNFCTLLPMRAIPFKVVCLLGMNEADFPRNQTLNSFDLMQYAPQKGDRAKRDDDRYLFLEALLSAQDVFYMSYVGRSLTKDEKFAPLYPSVLVSQLMNYLAENDLDWKNHILSKEAMTVFSPDNFTQGKRSFNQEWLDVTQRPLQNQAFLSPLANPFSPKEIELEDLIAFVQNPVKYYFNRQLGVYLESREDSIEEAEIFSLSGLERYTFFDDLVGLKEEDLAHYFHQAKLKGQLPAQNFAQLAQANLAQEIAPMRAQIEPYLAQDQTHLSVNLDLGSVNLVGNLAQCYGHDFIYWRVGKLRDKDLIKHWILHLVLATQSEAYQLKFFYKEGGEVKSLEFKPISQEEALAQLGIYIKAYVGSFQELDWAVYENMASFFKPKRGQALPEPDQLAQQGIDYLTENDLYFARLYQQTAEFDKQKIYQNTLDWFGKMFQYGV